MNIVTVWFDDFFCVFASNETFSRISNDGGVSYEGWLAHSLYYLTTFKFSCFIRLLVVALKEIVFITLVLNSDSRINHHVGLLSKIVQEKEKTYFQSGSGCENWNQWASQNHTHCKKILNCVRKFNFSEKFKIVNFTFLSWIFENF